MLSSLPQKTGFRVCDVGIVDVSIGCIDFRTWQSNVIMYHGFRLKLLMCAFRVCDHLIEVRILGLDWILTNLVK